MAKRTRRAVLALGTGALGALAGCAQERSGDGRDTGTDQTPTDTPRTRSERSPTESPSGDAAADAVSFDGGDPLGRLGGPFPERDVADYYLALLATADHAAAFPADRLGDGSARDLLAGTDFGAAAVVVFQDRRGSSHPDLNVRETTVDGRTLTVEAEYPGKGGTADITPNTLVARVPTASALDTARVVLQPQYGDPVRVATTTAYDELPAFDPAGDLVVRNRDCAAAPLSVAVTYEGDLFHRSGDELAPASVRSVEGLLAHPGEWTVAVDRGETTTERSWTLTDPPGDLLVEVAGDGTVSLAADPDGVDPTAPTACETDGYPYESSDPAENLDRPADLWVVDDSDGRNWLTVTIDDGDTEVFSDDFDLRAGYDKAKRGGLLAKRTDYEVSVTADDGRSVARTVTVEAGVEKVLVRVTEAGELTVATG